jgi:hypothetical protein
MAGDKGDNFGVIIALGLIGFIFILVAILFTFSADWKWFLALIGVCILLLLVGGILWNIARIPSIVIFLVALGVGIVAFYFLDKATKPPVEHTLLFQYYIQCKITNCHLVLG